MNPISASPADPPIPAAEARRRRGIPLLPLLLLILALFDLRTELLLLFDQVTITALLNAIAAHPLAVLVLIAQPSLWRRYGSERRAAKPKSLSILGP